MSQNEHLIKRVDEFALDVMETLARILPSGNLGFNARMYPSSKGFALASVTSAEELGLALTVNGEVKLRLVAGYRLFLSPGSAFLAVHSSEFKVYLEGVRKPLFTLDYVRDNGSNVPAAHINVHAEREDLTAAMAAAGERRRGKIYARQTRAGQALRLGELHFPVGGHRFRLCLEDVLEMLMIEFGIDVLDGAEGCIREGRGRWRTKQLAGAVGDDPFTAAKELERLGFGIEWPQDQALGVRHDRMTSY